MNRKIILTIIALVLLLWCPWVTGDIAKSRAVNGFNSLWKNTHDGCGSKKATDSVKIPFGYIVEIDYACGLLPSDSPEFHKRTKVFVSFIGTVHASNEVSPN